MSEAENTRAEALGTGGGEREGDSDGGSDRVERRGVGRARALVVRAVGYVRRRSVLDWAATACLVTALYAAFRHALTFRGTDFDDAYITFRYAENLARGHGPVYNPGERVEGTSAFLFMLLLAGARLLGIDVPTAAIGLGTLFFLALTIGAYFCVRSVLRDRVGQFLGVGAAAMVAASTPLAYYASTGMETTFYAALLLYGVLFFFRATLHEEHPRTWPVVMGFAAICRPEGFLIFGLLLGMQVVHFLSDGRGLRTTALASGRSLGIFALVFGPFLLLRLGYYGAWLPNTVTAKDSHIAEVRRIPLRAMFDTIWARPGVTVSRQWLEKLGVGAPLLLPGLAARRTRLAALVCLAIAASAAMELVLNDDWMPHFRMLTPAMAPLAVAIAFGLGAAFFRADESGITSKVLAVALSAFLVWHTADRVRYERNYTFPHSVGSKYYRSLARNLAAGRRDDDVLATDLAGMIPYYARMRTIDTMGLCDREIAQHGSSFGAMGKLHWNYVISRKPTFVIFNFSDGIRLLYQQPAFADQRESYFAVITPSYLSLPPREQKLLIVRKDRPGIQELAARHDWRLIDAREELHRLGW